MRERPEIFQNERVSASAGSGKTYALTKRFIALLAKEIDAKTKLPDPTRITALTFTRKSAGEFLGKILTRLADASSDPEKAKALSYEIEELTFGKAKDGKYITQDKVQLLLKQCVKNLNKMKLSTIDSFFSSTLKAFANETGIFSKISIIDYAQAKAEKEKIIENILHENSISKKTFSTFTEILKRASFGAEEKTLKKILNDNIENSHRMFLEVPDKSLWGNIDAILDYTPISWDPIAYQNELEELKEQLKSEECPAPFNYIIKFLEETDNNVVGSESTILERTISLFSCGKLNDKFDIVYNKKTYSFSEKIAHLLSSLFRRICDAHILRVCDASKATAQIAEMYEQLYNTNVRLAGKLSFDDIPILLNASAHSFSKLIEYRLDSKFKHWLFDEFQDTSRQQWNFFKNIIDEVISDESGEKTFYYVGDVKQSLYSWRGGDRLLFDDIFDGYNSQYPEQVIFDGKELVTSWRSGKNVISIINSIFEENKELDNAFLSSAATTFTNIFTKHISAETIENGKEPKKSLAQLRFVENVVRNTSAEMENVYSEIFEIIKETKPTSNGKTCAILVNNNSTAQDIVDYLKLKIAEENLDIEVSGELEKNILTDNVLVSSFVQLLKFVIHPSDSASEVYLKMTPFADLISQENFRLEIISTIASQGFEKLSEDIEEYLRKKIEFTQAQTENIERLKEACRDFDNSQTKGINNFIDFITDRKHRLSSIKNAIQVMTIHKSKGLGFTSVILPDLHKIKNIQDRGLKYIAQKHDHTIIQKTISYLPPKMVCQVNPALRESMQIEAENEAFENICKLYVALTRAERALYIIIPKLTKFDANAGSIRQLLISAFEPELRYPLFPKEKKIIYEDLVSRRIISIGDTDWHLSKTPLLETDTTPQLLPIKNPKICKEHERIVPSKSFKTSKDFDIKKIALGTAIHKAFEFVDTSNDSPEDKAMRAVKSSKTSDAIQTEVYNHLCNALKNPEIAKLFLEEKNQIVKTEFSFDALIDGKIARGSIDRLIINTDDNNKPISATIIDFKSSKNFVETYKPQVEIYKRAIENIFKIPTNNIAVKIVSYNDSQITNII